MSSHRFIPCNEFPRSCVKCGRMGVGRRTSEAMRHGEGWVLLACVFGFVLAMAISVGEFY